MIKDQTLQYTVLLQYYEGWNPGWSIETHEWPESYFFHFQVSYNPISVNYKMSP